MRVWRAMRDGFVEHAKMLTRPLLTRVLGGVRARNEKPPATRLASTFYHRRCGMQLQTQN